MKSFLDKRSNFYPGLKLNLIALFAGCLILSLLFFYETTDQALKEYIPSSCANSSLEAARKSCGAYQDQANYSTGALRITIPLAIISGLGYIAILILGKIKPY